MMLTFAMLAAWCLIHSQYPVHDSANPRRLTEDAAEGVDNSVPNLFDVNRF